MLGVSEMVVGISIASYNRSTHHGRPCTPPEPSNLSMTLHATSQSDSELELSQERVKYAMLGGSEVVVGTSIASYNRCLHHGAVAIRRRAPATLRTITPLYDSPRDLPK